MRENSKRTKYINATHPSKVYPWKIDSDIFSRAYKANDVLPIQFSQVKLTSSVEKLAVKVDRLKCLDDRRIKVLYREEPQPTLTVMFDFEDFIRREIGAETTIAEIARVLKAVEVAVRDEVCNSYEIMTAKISTITAFRIVKMEFYAGRCVELLALVSRDRGGQDLEDPVKLDPNVPLWHGACFLVYDRYLGLNSPDPEVKKAAGQLLSEEIRFEYRAVRSTSQYDTVLVGQLISDMQKFIFDFSGYAEAPFDNNLWSLRDIDLYKPRFTGSNVQNNTERRSYKPFWDESNIALVREAAQKLLECRIAEVSH